ncbi:siderophore synthetase component [Prauserella sediminis]|uniref:Siderophore synthetase component n=1 Tax=Prauserella sediminis TaxID=577680 RepID=A0A839XUV4_9PSEU|nr:IucA/IucC family protein [Prauserella sediminis]MBB3663605.1 siderophore synthetase component [Prauserella sediminis]
MAVVSVIDDDADELVLRDLVDALIQENVSGFGDARVSADGTLSVPVAGGEISVAVRDGGALQRYRLDRGPASHNGRPVSPDELLRLAVPDASRVAGVSCDVATAIAHASTVLAARRRGDTVDLLEGERMAATRNRPFHPTARAAAGWTAAELAQYGPMREKPLGLDWVAVRTRFVRAGEDPRSAGLAALVLQTDELAHLQEAIGFAGVDTARYAILPVHPWQYENVLMREFADEFAAGAIVPVTRDLGRFHPTASLRTVAMSEPGTRHVKLPLGVATLGAQRLLPPRYLDNGDKAQRTMRAVIDSDPVLRERVRLCDEGVWCGWSDGDEFADRPGQLAAQVRTYPNLGDAVAVPMAALAAHEWHTLAPTLVPGGDPMRFFAGLAGAFCELGMGFLRHGVLPELHGQNVVVAFDGGDAPVFVLRDHDTLRYVPEWMSAAGLPEPGYAIKPGARQSLRLDTGEELIGYFQTLGLQVNLYGIVDALCRYFELDERALWTQLRHAVVACLDRMELPGGLGDMIAERLLRAPTWPSRTVLGPLLDRGPSNGVSMPAGTGSVPNPLAEVPA